jgi:hypothetical protein
MDFYNDIVQIAKDILDHYDIERDDLTNDRQIIDRWANAQLKLVKSVPRRVVQSTLIANHTDPNIIRSLETIKAKLTNGEDINPYLSKGIFRPDYTDYLFSDWGIYHLHLSNAVAGRYFMARSDSLLFVIIDQNCAYLIDIRPHDERDIFAQKALLKTVRDEWPHILEPYRLKGCVDVSLEIDDPESITKMRKAGVNVVHRIGNDVYAPMGGGISTAATSFKVTFEVDKLCHMAVGARDYINQNKEEITGRIAKATGKPCVSTDFHLELNEKGFFVFERISGCGFPISP